MLRLIRWLCFPIARRLGWWPIAVYFALTLPVFGLRRLIWPLPPELAERLPDGFYPVFYLIIFLVVPGVLCLRNRLWYQVPARASQTPPTAEDG